jgi:hypothetical protein
MYKQFFRPQTPNSSNSISLPTTEVWLGISHLVNKKKQKNMAPRGEVKVNDTSMLFGQLQIIYFTLRSLILSHPAHVHNSVQCAWGKK